MASDPSKNAGELGKAMADRLFAGRKGHGRAPISYLQLNRETLADVLTVAIELGAQQQLTPARLKDASDHLLTAEDLVGRIELDQGAHAAGGAGRPQTKPYPDKARAYARRAGLRALADLVVAHTASLPVEAPSRAKWVNACDEVNALLAEAVGSAAAPAATTAGPGQQDPNTVVKWLRLARGIDPNVVIVDCGYDTAQLAKQSGRTSKLLRLEIARKDLEVIDSRAVNVADVLPS